MDVLTPEQRRKNMRAIKNKNTKIEELLAKALWAKGHRYRRNNKSVFGKPDFTFKKYKIAIFCDSEYFHGKDWKMANIGCQFNLLQVSPHVRTKTLDKRRINSRNKPLLQNLFWKIT